MCNDFLHLFCYLHVFFCHRLALLFLTEDNRLPKILDGRGLYSFAEGGSRHSKSTYLMVGSFILSFNGRRCVDNLLIRSRSDKVSEDSPPSLLPLLSSCCLLRPRCCLPRLLIRCQIQNIVLLFWHSAPSLLVLICTSKLEWTASMESTENPHGISAQHFSRFLDAQEMDCTKHVVLLS